MKFFIKLEKASVLDIPVFGFFLEMVEVEVEEVEEVVEETIAMDV